MAILLHGTTRSRAERIWLEGPNPRFTEPGSGARAEGFSTCLEAGPFPLGTPEIYAVGKANQFKNEGGPAIPAVDVPDDIVALALSEFFPREQGVIQFDVGAGLDELRAVWPSLWKEVRPLDSP